MVNKCSAFAFASSRGAEQHQLCSESSTVRSGTRQQHLWRNAMAAASSLSFPTWIKTCQLPLTEQDLWSRKTAYGLVSSAEGVGKPTASFWHTVSSSVKLKCSLSEWLSLANKALVQVPGFERERVEEERLYSKLALIKDERRNCLLSDHLNARLVLATQRMWVFRDFPFLRAVQKWFEAKKWCTAAHAQQPQREPELMEMSDEREDAE